MLDAPPSPPKSLGQPMASMMLSINAMKSEFGYVETCLPSRSHLIATLGPRQGFPHHQRISKASLDRVENRNQCFDWATFDEPYPLLQ
jgi:hypothetical protein